MVDATLYPLPAGSRLLQDLGFLAFTRPEVTILMPTKTSLRPGAHVGATTDASHAHPASAADRARQQQCQAVSHRERPHPPVEGGGPRPRDGARLRSAQLPGTLEPLAAYDLIGINSIEQCGDKLHGHHTALLSSQGCHASQRGRVVGRLQAQKTCPISL